ncbi:MAG TPA: asparagine synthase (glutamine-hydrolyzing) [Burkholderiales bacterium]|nr:asparagine synthase (glutamine-hydrolyzing) [Burkholderiales bacterium]
MGGIAGWIIPGRSAPDAGALLPALESLAHRGASGEGIYAARTESGHQLALSQPDCDEASGSALMLDGTLANGGELRAELGLRGFVFEDPSSAEVLAKAYQQWDKDVVHHLRGAFAFALWDANRERLLLARDRFGEKPLYLCERAGALYFASELKALLRMPGIAAQPDPGAVHDYLAYRYVPAPRTLISGVRKLMPGTYALWQFGRLREVRYWFPPDRVACRGQPVGEPIAAFTEKLDEAVRLRAPGAGVLLSGGVDSAALLALAARHETPQTFSAGFADDPDSELPRAAALAKHFGAEHHEIVLSPDDVVAALEYSVIQRDAPVSRPSDIALHLIAREAARTVGAVLTGDGSDEVLGGYRRHVAERFGWCFRSLPTLLMLAGPLARRRPALQTAFASLRTSDSQARYARWVGAETGALLKAPKHSPRTNLPPFDADPRASSLRRALYFDQASWLPDNVLERGDRMTMAESLETRAPFLDHKLAELVSALPDDVRVRGLETKWILHQAAKPLLGNLPTRKGGWRVPVGAWLRGELREYLLEHLRGQGSVTRSYYEPKALDRVIDDHLAGRRNHETALWTLLNLEIWQRALPRA